MTEAEWLACDDHSAMLAFLGTKGAHGFRKYRLLLVAYCRTFLPALLKDERTRLVVDVAEAYSEGAASKAELERAKQAALKAVKGRPQLDSAVRSVTHGLVKRQAVEFPDFCLRPWRATSSNYPTRAQRRQLGRLIRDMFGNPFHPLLPLPAAVLAWNDGTVRRIAEGIYEERAFDRLPILADALLDAGCDGEALIQHCRGDGPHVRGCWAVDLILGKE
jgi:hypothetical protein